MNKYNIENSTLSFFLINSFFINIGYNLFTTNSNIDSIIDITISSIILILLLRLILYLKNNNQDLITQINNLKYLKYPIIILLVVLFGISNIYFLKIITNFIHYYILKEESLFTISLTFILTIMYLVSKGIKTISRTSNICFYLYILLTILGYIGLTNYINLNNLKPLLTTNLNNHLTTIKLFTSYSIYPLFLLLFIKTDKKENKRITIFSIISFLNIITTLILIISVLGIDLTNIYIYPDIAIYKKISFLNIIERVEIFLSFNQLLNSIFIISFNFYLIKKLIITNIKIKKESMFLTLLTLLFLFIINTITISKNTYLFINLIVLFIIAIYALITKFFKIRFNSSN